MQDIDECSLNYAEIKALATGDPRIIEHCTLTAEVGKLKMLKSSHLSQRYDLEDRVIYHYPSKIDRIERQIAGYTADMATAAANTPADKDAFTMTVGGEVCHDKKRAGTAILEACKAMTSSESAPIGTYRGFEMLLSYDPFSKEFSVTVKGTVNHKVALGQDILGNITRINHKIDDMGNGLIHRKEELTAVQAQMETAKEQAAAPFPREKELTEKSERLAQLTLALKLKEQDREILDDTPDEAEVGTPERKAKNRDRER